MRASELRIGNWYYGDALGGGYEQITAKEILDFFDDPLDDYYQPIPLTEEWLFKFGFYYKNEYDAYIKKFKSESHCDEFIIRRDDFVVCDMDIKVEIKHVHQLQNLYFALTGEELKIEL